MTHAHDHGIQATTHEGHLWWALGLTGAVLLVEVAGALLTNSLASLSDAAHVATDIAGLVIALAAVRLSRRPPDSRRTFGFARAEALGALVNGVLITAAAIRITGWLILDPILAVLIGLWVLRSKQPILAAHVVAIEGSDPETLRRRLNESLHASFDIAHSTLQVETVHCGTQGCDPEAARDALCRGS